MSEQGHHEHHGLGRGAQAIEDRTSAGAEGFVALVTDKALFLSRMNTNVALARLASGRAVLIGAEYGLGVHDGPPGFVWKHAKRSMSGPPFLLQVSFTTVKWRATKGAALGSKMAEPDISAICPCWIVRSPCGCISGGFNARPVTIDHGRK